MKKPKSLGGMLALLALGCGPKSDVTPMPESAVVSATEQPEEAGSTVTADSPVVEIPNARVVQEMLTGGQPADEHYVALAEAGYKTIIDLRVPGEPGSEHNASRAQAAGLTHVNVPIEGSAGITKESVQIFSDAFENADGPVVVHCGSGNRVGAMFGMTAFWIDGATPEEALTIAKESGMTTLEQHVKSLLGLDRERP